MTVELNTLAPKKWTANYSGSAPTIDITDGVLVGDFAIDTSNSAIWQCTDNTDTAAVWVLKNVSGIPLTGSSAITGSLIPTTDNDIDLGDATHQWRDLYLSGATMYLGGSTIEKDGELLEWDGYKLLDTNSSLFNDITDVTAVPPANLGDTNKIFGTYYSPAVGYGDGGAIGSAGSIAPTASYNVHVEDGAHTDLTASLTAGNKIVTVRSTTGFSAGDSVLIHQVQVGGGGMTAEDAGEVREVVIASIDGETQVTLVGSTNFSYRSSSGGDSLNQNKAQMVKMVQYLNIDLSDVSASLTCDPWDGFSGGLLAFMVSGEIFGSGNISASGKGFHSGYAKPGEGWLGGVRDTNTGGQIQVGTPIDNGGTSVFNSGEAGGNKVRGEYSGSPVGGLAYPTSTETDLLNKVYFGGGGGTSGGNSAGVNNAGGAIYAKIADFTSSGYTGIMSANGLRGGSGARSSAGGSVYVSTPTTFPAGQIEVAGAVDNSKIGSVGFEYGPISDFQPTSDFRLIAQLDSDVALGSGSASDEKTPTQLAVKTYVDAELALKTDISTDSFDLVAIASTTDTTPTALTLEGNSEGATGSLIIPIDTAWAFTVHVVAIDVTNGFANSKKFSFDGLALNDGGTVTVTSSTLGTDASQGTFTGSVALSADTTNDALRIMATGIGTDTIRWTARVELTQVD